jgi:hypothetical protein
MIFDWAGSKGIPVLNIMTCAAGFGRGPCTVRGKPMQTGPFPGQVVTFNGSRYTPVDPLPDPVPIPASFWLMSSGLLGLAAMARRKNLKETVS